MDRLSEPAIRGSFVNCSKGAVRRINLPADLAEHNGAEHNGAEHDWSGHEFLGWTDPRAPMQAFLVVPSQRHGLVGVQLRRNPSGGGRARMCTLCTTVHSGQGVTLMVAARAGRAGRDGNTVGLDMCADLACSLYARGTKPLPAMSAAHETLAAEDRVARLCANLDDFLRRVLRA